MIKITQNFYRVKPKTTIHRLLRVFAFLLLTAWSANAADITANTGGTVVAPLLWNATTTWNGGVVPNTGDNIIIPNGSVVAINIGTSSTVFGALTIQNGGTLQSTTSSSGIILASVTVDNGGVFNPFRTALTINGPTSISGTMYCEATTSRTDVFAGNFTLTSTAVWAVGTSGGTSSRTVNFQGDFINNASSFGTVPDSGVRTFSGTGKSIGGTTVTIFPNVAVTGTPTIASGATLTVNNALTGAGTLTNLGTLNLGQSAVPSISGLTATGAGNTVNYTRAGGQTVKAVGYFNLGLGGTNSKTITTGITIAGNLTINGTATAAITTGGIISVASLTLGTTAQASGTSYGGTSSGAANINTTYFASTTAGNYINVLVSGSPSPTLTADASANTVDNAIDITFTDDATWRAAVTAVKIGTTTLTAGTDYDLTAGNLQLKPSGSNALLTTSGSKSVTVVATDYLDATVTQVINPGVPTAANSTATINTALAPNTTRTVTATARDQYNNLVSGYAFKYDAAITDNDATTNESYTIGGAATTATANDVAVTATNGSGVATFDIVLPATIDGDDGISVQVQLNDGTTNVGSVFSYLQLTPQTITFGALTPVTYGDTPFALTATASSGLPVSYASSNTAVATVSGNTVTIVGAGSTNITASQAGNGTYAAATPVVQALTVNAKALTIPDAVAQNKVYDGTTDAVITGTLTGIINSDDVSYGTGTFDTADAGTAKTVTSITLTGTKAGNYSLTQPTGLTADIDKANQTITMAATAFKYSNFADYAPATSATSGVNPITYTSSNPAVATIVANQVHFVGAGVTTITASQAASTNYNAAADVEQELTVDPSNQPKVAFLYTGTLPAGANKLYTMLNANYDVTAIQSAGTGAATDFDAAYTGHDLIVLHESVTSGNLAAQKLGTKIGTVPVLNTKAHMYGKANWPTGTGANGANGDTFINVNSDFQTHPIFGGVTMTGGEVIMANTNGIIRYATGVTATSNIASNKSGTVTNVSILEVNNQNVADANKYMLIALAAANEDLTDNGLLLLKNACDYLMSSNVYFAPTIWTGTASGGSWSNNAPTSAVEAIVGGVFDTSVSTGFGFTAKKLTVNSGATLTVNSGTNVTVQNEVINNGTLVVENNANLVQVNNVANTGNITVNRNSNALLRLDYTMWSSPVAGTQTLADFSPLTSTNRFYEYNAATDLYNAVSNTGTFALGKGYLIRMPNDASADTPTAYPGVFTGVPNNGNVSLAGLASGLYYAVGNPYPSTISAESFLAGNSTDGVLYCWRKTNAALGSAYATYTAGGATTTTPTSAAPNGTIQVGQGFVVKTTATALDFTNTMRAGSLSTQFFKTKQMVERNRVWLNLTNATGVFSQALVGYMTDATQGVDAGIDGKYINDSPVALTSNINNEEYTIQGRALPFDPSDVVALNFKTDVAGDYTIGLDHVDGLFAAGQDVYLVDGTTGTETDLKAGAYTFTAAAGTDNARFSLKYQRNLGVNAPAFNENNVTVYKNKGVLYVNSGSLAMTNVKVYDVQGRLLAEQKNVNATSTAIKDLKGVQQVLVVKITAQDNTVVTKKVVN